MRKHRKRNPRRKATLIHIEAAGAIANLAPAFESFEVAKGTLGGSPPIPDDDLTTIRVPFYLVAHKKLDDDVVTNLTRAIIDTMRGPLALLSMDHNAAQRSDKGIQYLGVVHRSTKVLNCRFRASD